MSRAARSKCPIPPAPRGVLTLQIRRAALKRAAEEWSGHALVFLPERLGRTARVVFRLNGDISSPGIVEAAACAFEGVRLSFSSWRGVLGDVPRLAGNLPQLGTGDVTFDLTLANGLVEKAGGGGVRRIRSGAGHAGVARAGCGRRAAR